MLDNLEKEILASVVKTLKNKDEHVIAELLCAVVRSIESKFAGMQHNIAFPSVVTIPPANVNSLIGKAGEIMATINTAVETPTQTENNKKKETPKANQKKLSPYQEKLKKERQLKQPINKGPLDESKSLVSVAQIPQMAEPVKILDEAIKHVDLTTALPPTNTDTGKKEKPEEPSIVYCIPYLSAQGHMSALKMATEMQSARYIEDNSYALKEGDGEKLIKWASPLVNYLSRVNTQTQREFKASMLGTLIRLERAIKDNLKKEVTNE